MASLFLSRALAGRLPEAWSPHRLFWRLEAWLLRGVWASCRCLPTDTASSLGAGLAVAVGPRTAIHSVILENLKIALPAETEQARRRIAREIWRNAGRIMTEYAILDRIVGPEAKDRIEIVRLDREHREPGKPVCYVTAHMANWDILDIMTSDDGQPGSAVAAVQRNPYIEAALLRMRAARACFREGRVRVISSRGAIREMMRDLAEGRNLGFLLDQRHKRGEPVPLMGHQAMTATIPAALALRAGVPMLPIEIERLKGCRFRITVHPPLSTAGLDLLPQRDAAVELTRRLHLHFERWIAARPEQWLCLKRRWPRSVLKQMNAKTAIDAEPAPASGEA